MQNKKNLSLDIRNQRSRADSGFTLLELLVVIAIIGALAGVIAIAVGNARVRGRDAKRVGDMRQMMTALDQYYIQHGVYPTGTASIGPDGALLSDSGTFNGTLEPMIPAYLPIIPESPNPADGNCGNTSGRGNNNYWYEVNDVADTYTLTFCIGKDSESWPSGIRSAGPNGVK